MSLMADMAIDHFSSGFNCAQSVLAVFCEKYGLDKDTALKMCSGLGCGVRFGEICGAVSGSVLVIGLKYGQDKPENKTAKDDCYAKTIEFINLFRTNNGAVVCRDILGFDLSIQEEYDQVLKKNLFNTTCVDMVRSAVTLLEALGYAAEDE